MGTGRFLVPTLAPLYATLGCLAVAGMAPAQSARSTLRASVLLSLALSSAIFLLTSWRAERAGLEAERPNLDSRAVVALWLRQHAAPQDTLLSNEIGQLAYFSRLHTEDLHGLTDSHIAHLAVATMGAGKPGHEKLDLAYSLAKHPTWICVPGLVAGAVTMRPQYPDLEQYEVIHISDELPLPPYADLLHRVGSPIEALPGAPQPRDP
jgi:hypothetical protein